MELKTTRSAARAREAVSDQEYLSESTFMCLDGAVDEPLTRNTIVRHVEIETFLTAYRPKFICPSCLAAVRSRHESDVRGSENTLLAEHHAETQVGKCLNCNVTDCVVRRFVTSGHGRVNFRRPRRQVAPERHVLRQDISR